MEERSYRPHLTIGREVILPTDFSREAFKREFPQVHSEVTAISLMKSERIGGRLTYTEIYRKELAEQGRS